jgi:hypothetical protein
VPEMLDFDGLEESTDGYTKDEGVHEDAVVVAV